VSIKETYKIYKYLLFFVKVVLF